MIMNVFCKDTKVEYEDYLSQLFRATIGLLANEDVNVLNAGWDCVNSIVKVDYFLTVYCRNLLNMMEFNKILCNDNIIKINNGKFVQGNSNSLSS